MALNPKTDRRKLLLLLVLGPDTLSADTLRRRHREMLADGDYYNLVEDAAFDATIQRLLREGYLTGSHAALSLSLSGERVVGTHKTLLAILRLLPRLLPLRGPRT
ncbi:MAG: hypothetical protein Q7R94_02330 [bacterium]|nr:hypothetical protein [bacterium]